MKYKIVKPELLLFVDEVGANMSQQEDRNIGGKKLLVAKDEWALCQSTMNDCHFNVWGFTSASREPVCCAKNGSVSSNGISTMGRDSRK